MRNQREIKSVPYYKMNIVESIFKREMTLIRMFLVPFIIFSSILTLTASCKNHKYENQSKVESTDRRQGSARASREKVIEYLQKSYLIEDPMNYQVELTNDYLNIDGKKQPENIHLHIIKNFVENPDGHLQVTYTVTTD